MVRLKPDATTDNPVRLQPDTTTDTRMTIDDWLKMAIADAERRGLADLRPILEGLARATRALRDADLGGRAA